MSGLDEIEAALRARLDTLRADASAIRRSIRDEEVEVGDKVDSSIDERAAADQVVVHDRRQAEIVEVAAALQRFEDGTYGECEECGDEIVPRRLKILPTTRHCVDCQEELEKRQIPAARKGLFEDFEA